MQKLWLVFAQSVTICLGILFVATLFKHDLLPNRAALGTFHEVVREPGAPAAGSFRDAARKAMPSVVNIFTSKEVRSRHPSIFPDNPELRRFFEDNLPPETQQQLSLGSGVIVLSDGYILTNDHVIDGAQEIQVALSDGRTVKAELVGADPETDIAVLKVDLKGLPAITFGTSEQVKVGDIALAIGNPFGVGETVTMGIVSALGRSRLGINTFENFIQTDAAINPGNSGGALVDAAGNLIGINSAIYSKTGGSQGIGFSIPVSIAKNVMEEIIKTGGVTRGWIGVEVQDITPDLAESFRLDKPSGALISAIMKGGPADRAGIKPGDVLVEVNGVSVQDSQEMLNQVASLKPEQNAKFKIIRNRQAHVFTVIVGKRPKGTIKNLDEEEAQ
ncbi:MAG: Do family serine endopeptidase [Betaproteobacteria bacterium]|nr:Do family serine endopeptidase [Betaproteobacteria bacterium]